MAGFAEIFLRRNREEGWREEVTQARGCPFCGALSGEVHGIELQDGLLVVNSRSVRLTKTEAAIVGKLLKSFRKVVLKERLYNEIVSANIRKRTGPIKKSSMLIFISCVANCPRLV